MHCWRADEGTFAIEDDEPEYIITPICEAINFDYDGELCQWEVVSSVLA